MECRDKDRIRGASFFTIKGLDLAKMSSSVDWSNERRTQRLYSCSSANDQTPYSLTGQDVDTKDGLESIRIEQVVSKTS